MNMIRHLQTLFNYDEWANHEVLASFKSAKTAPTRSLKLMSHMLSAERLWWERLEGKNQTLPVWPDLTLSQCEAEAADMSVRWKKYLSEKSEADLSVTVSYKNSKGEDWSSRPDDILLHVIMHSAYHRGQIAADMRAGGFTPASTDFIRGVRQGLVE
jgi:uncharacterized damage-inducible protein DinB